MTFIVCNDDAIWGTGATVAEAWADFHAGMKAARIEPDVDDYRCDEATADLIAKVFACGGAIAWTYRDGVACTHEESTT